MASTPTPASAPPSPTSSWLGRLGLAVLVPLLVFALLEVGLRLGGFGRNTDFFISEGSGWYRTNPHYTELFFPASFGLKPVNFRIQKHKPAGTVRVFVIGESAAMGVPEPGFALAPQLRAQLRAAYPGKNYEVCNLGITAINSHVIRHLVDQAVTFEPDLLVVYMGNNEVVGPYGPSSALGRRMFPLPLIRLSLWLRTTRTGQLMQRALHAAASAGADFKDWRGMEMFAGNAVAASDPRLQTVYANFSENLSHLLETARRHGVKVVLSTVAVNVADFAPFASLHRSGLSSADHAAWSQARDEARDAEALGQVARARAALNRAVAIDPEYADAYFVRGKFRAQQGDAAGARSDFLQALQWDALRFRTDARLNEIIRNLAVRAGANVRFVDAARALGSDANSTTVPAGHALFFEHVHFTFEGNYALARVLAEAAGQQLFGASAADAAWLSGDACADAVGFTEFGRATMQARMDELTTRPPFTAQSSYAADRAHALQVMAEANAALAKPGALEAAAGKVEAARTRDPNNPFLTAHAALLRARLGEVAGALALTESLASLEPPSPEQSAQRAFLLLALRRNAEAETVLLNSARSDPYYFQTYGLLAQLWTSTAQIEKALEFFHALVAKMPESRSARLTYASLLAHSGRQAEAVEQWLAVLHITPDDEGALEPLVQLRYEQQKPDEALPLMLAAFAYNPRDFANDERLIEIYDQRGDLGNTVKYMRALAESGPVKAALHYDLAVRLAKLGQQESALVELHRARASARAEGDLELLKQVDAALAQP